MTRTLHPGTWLKIFASHLPEQLHLDLTTAGARSRRQFRRASNGLSEKELSNAKLDSRYSFVSSEDKDPSSVLTKNPRTLHITHLHHLTFRSFNPNSADAGAPP